MTTPITGQHPLLSIADAAALTGTTERMIRTLVARRDIPVVKVGRLVRIRPDALEAYLERSTRPAR